MGRQHNKKNKNKNKKKHDPTNAYDINKLCTDVEKALSERRDRRALALAKMLRKHTQYTPAMAPLVCSAYEMRLQVMLDNDQKQEAMQMVHTLSANHPEWRTTLIPNLWLRLDIEGGRTEYIGTYGQDPEQTALIDTYIKNNLRDPRLLAAHPHMADDHPLKQAATALIEAWTELESLERTGPAYQAMLRIVGRRSPLLGWRLWLQALDAFYQHRDDVVVKCLERMQAFAALDGMRIAMHKILNGDDAVRPCIKKLKQQLAGNSLHAELHHIDRVIEANGSLPKLVKTLIVVSRHPYFQRKKGLWLEILSQTLNAYEFDLYVLEDESQSVVEQIALLPDFTLACFLYFARYKIETPDYWEGILKECKDWLSKLDQALIYAEMAHMAVQYKNATQDLPFWMMDVDVPSFNPTSYWQASIERYPLSDTFKAWYNYLDNLKESEKVLRKWHARFPDDVEPLIHLVDSCRQRGVSHKALTLFADLEKLAAGMPRVEAMRHYLLIDNAWSQLKKKRYNKLAQWLDKIPEKAEEHVRVLKAIFTWYAAAMSHKPQTDALLDDLHQFKRPLSALLIVQQLLHLQADMHQRFLNRFEDALNDGRLVLENLATLLHVHDPIWGWGFRKEQLIDKKCVIQAAHDADLTQVDLDEIFSFYLGDFHRDDEIPACEEVLWLLTARAIALRDNALPQYLVHRAVLLLIQANNSVMQDFIMERTANCLACASRLAEQSGRHEQLNFVKQVARHILYKEYREDGRNMEESEVAALIEIEASCRRMEDILPKCTPRNSAQRRKSKPSKPRKKKINLNQIELF